MNKENSINGCGYIPRNAQAVCLKTNVNTRLGEVVYKIIKDPYERVFERQELFAMMPRRQKRMAVNVLDANTGLTYAVEYEPVNLVRSTPEPGADKSGKKVEFIDRARQIAEELNAMFSAGGGISDKCGVAFFSISDNGDGKTSTGAAFVAGRGDRVVDSISAACSKDPQALELVKRGTMEAMLHRMFTGSEKKE